VQETALRTNPVYKRYYTFWSKLIVMELVPYLTLIVLNAVIVWKIRQSRTFRKSFDNTRKQKVLHLSYIISGLLSRPRRTPFAVARRLEFSQHYL
jgi:hypothetical protein